MSQSNTTIYILNHIIDDNVYNLIDSSYVQIGKAFLQAIIKKVTIITLKDISLSHIINHDFIRKCVQYLTAADSQSEILSKSQKVYMFLGEMFVCRQFQYLHAFQNEIANIIKQEKTRMQLTLNQSMIMGKDVDLVDSCNNSIIEVIDLLQEKQVIPHQQEEKYDQEIGNSIKNYLLSVARYRSQLNYLCQMMKIPFPKVEILRHHHYYQIKLALSFSCIYLNKRLIHLSATSYNSYYQQALQSVYFKLLRQIYLTVPQLWKDFVNLKSKKTITT